MGRTGGVLGSYGATCGSEEGRDCDQDGDTEARLGSVVSLRARDEMSTRQGHYYWGTLWLFGATLMG